MNLFVSKRVQNNLRHGHQLSGNKVVRISPLNMQPLLTDLLKMNATISAPA